jgi:hypothetical protein
MLLKPVCELGLVELCITVEEIEDEATLLVSLLDAEIVELVELLVTY